MKNRPIVNGSSANLPIALGLLVASGQLPADCLRRTVVIGELGLGGKLRAAPGALPVALSLCGGPDTLLLPDANNETRANIVRA